MSNGFFLVFDITELLKKGYSENESFDILYSRWLKNEKIREDIDNEREKIPESNDKEIKLNVIEREKKDKRNERDRKKRATQRDKEGRGKYERIKAVPIKEEHKEEHAGENEYSFFNRVLTEDIAIPSTIPPFNAFGVEDSDIEEYTGECFNE